MPKANKTIKQQVKKEIKQQLSRVTELKFHRVQRLMNTLSYSGFIEDLSLIAQGQTDSTRIGDKLTPTSFNVQGWSDPDQGTGVWRLIIFRWKDDSTPGADDILFSTGTIYGVYAPYNHDQRNKFNILYDKHMHTSVGYYSLPFNVSKKLGKVPVYYTAGGTVGSNKIYSLVINDDFLANSPAQPTLTYKINYTDM